MPRGDGTGPLGQGPMTGRGVGYCASNAAAGFASRPAIGRGLGGPGGGGWPGGGKGGHGFRNRFHATGVPFRALPPQPDTAVNRGEEIALLKSESERMRSALETIERRLEQLETT